MIDRQRMLKQMLSIGVTDHFCMFCPNVDSFIIRGGTKEHSFRIPFDIALAKKLRISYKQEGRLILEKNLKDVNLLGDDLIYYELSEKDTLKFKADIIVTVQMRVELEGKRVITSEIFPVEVVDIIDDRELSDESIQYYAIEAEVNDQRIKVSNYFDLVTNSSIYKGRFYFDSTWKKFIKIAVFTDNYNHTIYSPINEVNGIYECDIPDLILLNTGWIHVGVSGWYKDGITEYRKPTVWSNAVRVKLGCSPVSGSITIGGEEITNRDNLYIYCGATDNLDSIIPSDLELVRGDPMAIVRDGLVWNHKDIYGTGRYAVLAVPSFIDADCIKMLVGDFSVEIDCDNFKEYNGYKFYYFSSPIVGDFTCKYIFKEENK